MTFLVGVFSHCCSLFSLGESALPWKAMRLLSHRSWRQACFTQLTGWLMGIQWFLA